MGNFELRSAHSQTSSWSIASRSQLMGKSMLVAFALMCKKHKYKLPTEQKIGA